MVSQPGTRDKEGQGAKDCRHTAMCRLNLVEDLAHPLTPHQAPGIVTHSGRPPCLLQGGLPLVPQNRTTSNWRWEIPSWRCLYSHLTRYYPFANQQSLLCVHLCQHFLAVFSQCKDKNLTDTVILGRNHVEILRAKVTSTLWEFPELKKAARNHPRNSCLKFQWIIRTILLNGETKGERHLLHLWNFLPFY